MKISKNKCYQIAKQFCDLENDYLMGIIYDNKNIKIDMVIPDLLKDKKVLYRYDTFISKPTKQMLARHLFYKITEIE